MFNTGSTTPHNRKWFPPGLKHLEENGWSSKAGSGGNTVAWWVTSAVLWGWGRHNPHYICITATAFSEGVSELWHPEASLHVLSHSLRRNVKTMTEMDVRNAKKKISLHRYDDRRRRRRAEESTVSHSAPALHSNKWVPQGFLGSWDQGLLIKTSVIGKPPD